MKQNKNWHRYAAEESEIIMHPSFRLCPANDLTMRREGSSGGALNKEC